MLEAKHQYSHYLFFKYYTFFKIKRNFHNVHLNGQFIDKNLPILILANHISWWDGFWINYFNEKVTKRKLYFMMLEDQLNKYKFFSKIGGYSVKKNSKDIIKAIDYTKNLLTDKNKAVFLFPQGEIQSLYTDYIHFEKGIFKIVRDIKNLQIILLCNFIEYFSNQKPTLYMYFTEFSKDVIFLEKDYNQFYSICKNYSRQ